MRVSWHLPKDSSPFLAAALRLLDDAAITAGWERDIPIAERTRLNPDQMALILEAVYTGQLVCALRFGVATWGADVCLSPLRLVEALRHLTPPFLYAYLELWRQTGKAGSPFWNREADLETLKGYLEAMIGVAKDLVHTPAWIEDVIRCVALLCDMYPAAFDVRALAVRYARQCQYIAIRCRRRRRDSDPDLLEESCEDERLLQIVKWRLWVSWQLCVWAYRQRYNDHIARLGARREPEWGDGLGGPFMEATPPAYLGAAVRGFIDTGEPQPLPFP